MRAPRQPSTRTRNAPDNRAYERDGQDGTDASAAVRPSMGDARASAGPEVRVVRCGARQDLQAVRHPPTAGRLLGEARARKEGCAAEVAPASRRGRRGGRHPAEAPARGCTHHARGLLRSGDWRTREAAQGRRACRRDGARSPGLLRDHAADTGRHRDRIPKADTRPHGQPAIPPTLRAATPGSVNVEGATPARTARHRCDR